MPTSSAMRATSTYARGSGPRALCKPMSEAERAREDPASATRRMLSARGGRCQLAAPKAPLAASSEVARAAGYHRRVALYTEGIGVRTRTMAGTTRTRRSGRAEAGGRSKGMALALTLTMGLLAAGCAAAPAAATAPAAAPGAVETPKGAAPAGPSSHASASGDSVSTRERSTTQIAPGVYVIRHEDAPDTFPQGNTTVIVGEREVLVVDSCYLPSSARKDVAQIRAWTDKPVRYLVNTHWHYDHTMGNGVYKDAFPSIAIVAHTETRKQIQGYNPQWFTNFPERAARFKQRIDAGKDDNGKPYTEGELAELRTALAGVNPVWAEFRELAGRRDLAPTVSFDREIDVDLGNREVRVMHLGRGNTAGDAIVVSAAGEDRGGRRSAGSSGALSGGRVSGGAHRDAREYGQAQRGDDRAGAWEGAARQCLSGAGD